MILERTKLGYFLALEPVDEDLHVSYISAPQTGLEDKNIVSNYELENKFVNLLPLLLFQNGFLYTGALSNQCLLSRHLNQFCGFLTK